MDSPILPARFYGNTLQGLYEDKKRKIEEDKKRWPADAFYDKRPRSVFQPNEYKEEFWKQHDALANAAENSDGDDILCCFVFQDEKERRRFIVTYPEDFWKDSEHMPLEKRVFYEVIPEYSPCFLYYDLEYEVDLNKEINGIRMTRTLIDVTCEYIKKHWDYSCNRSMVINLDSSRPDKFSKHLIFSTKDVAFANNYTVGYLVKQISADIQNYISQENSQHEILDKFNKADLDELFVETSKGKKIFVDLNVYTKNRHFRTYKATKWGKKSYLLQASDCEYSLSNKFKNKDLEIFLNSLISYFPKKKKLNVLSFDENKKTEILNYSQHTEKRLKLSCISKQYPKSPYPVLDKYISQYIHPGKIRDTKYLESSHLVIYEILNNRYCENIKRWHKSNNIYYVVDTLNKIMYQKCHDEDCSGFTSTPLRLPNEVTFYFEDEVDSLFLNLNDSDFKKDVEQSC